MGLLSSIDKEFCILGKNFVKKIKINKYEKYILGEIKTLLRTTILEDLDYITGSPDINEVYENQSSANKLLLENLYKNLDEEAKNNLNIILERNSRVVNYIKQSIKFPKAKQIYTKEELQELDTIKQFEDETEVHKDYFKWKDCILPVNSFEPSVFLHKHGIDMIKNKNEILGAIIDVGANVGDSALIFRKNFPDNKIISFEPEEKNCKLCLKYRILVVKKLKSQLWIIMLKKIILRSD